MLHVLVECLCLAALTALAAGKAPASSDTSAVREQTYTTNCQLPLDSAAVGAGMPLCVVVGHKRHELNLLHLAGLHGCHIVAGVQARDATVVKASSPAAQLPVAAAMVELSALTNSCCCCCHMPVFPHQQLLLLLLLPHSPTLCAFVEDRLALIC
jgi:hypothetical protein